MAEVESRFSNGKGKFVITENGEEMGEMTASINEKELTVHHTEVKPEGQGKGYAQQLLHALAEYARQHRLQVIAECRYVYTQFGRHAELYADIWKPNKG